MVIWLFNCVKNNYLYTVIYLLYLVLVIVFTVCKLIICWGPILFYDILTYLIATYRCAVLTFSAFLKEVIFLTKVSIREGEPFERALKRFKKRVEQAGILKEVRKREFHVKKSVQVKLKKRAAEARARKRQKRMAQRGFN